VYFHLHDYPNVLQLHVFPQVVSFGETTRTSLVPFNSSGLIWKGHFIRFNLIIQHATQKLIEQILSPRNLQKALHQVIANKDSAGVDGMKTTQLSLSFLK
jgi:hypothetical protein